jgi:alpha/beta superfamily hydrolase
VGRSEGVHDGGQGEIDDTLAAIAYLAVAKSHPEGWA